MPDREVRKLSSPPCSDARPQQQPYCLSHPIARSVGTELPQPREMKQNTGVPQPRTRSAQPLALFTSSEMEPSFGILGPAPLYLGTPRGSGPVPPLSLDRGAKVCLYGKGVNCALLEMALFSISHIIKFSLFSQDSAAPVFLL